MPTLTDLLADHNAALHVVAQVNYLSSVNVESVEWVSQNGWTDPVGGPVGTYIPPLLDTGLDISQHLDPQNPQEAFGTYSQISLVNDINDPSYKGRYDGWQRNSIDNRLTYIYVVGILSTGQRVELADVISTPLFTLRGIEVPDVDEHEAILNVRDDSHTIDQALQPVTYSPPCLAYPGSNIGCVDFGLNYDQTSSFAAAGWVYLEDPTVPFQYVFTKLTTTAGYSLDVGNGVIITAHGITPPSTFVAPGILHARFWHFISISIDTSAHTTEIGIDGASVALTTGITGAPTVSTATFRHGCRLRGKLSRWTIWNTAKTVAAMWAQARIPVVPSASDLLAYFPPDENIGTVIHDRKTGSTITGTMGAGVTWDTAAWHLSGIVGNYRPFVLGTVARVPATWLDPVAQVAEVSYGGCALISEVQSNHNALGAIWTPNLAAGTFQVTVGALNGTYSATVTANNLWGTALQIAATSTAVAAILSPVGPCTICTQHTPSQSGAVGWLIGWQSGSSVTPGAIGLGITTGNRLYGFCCNDIGVVFTLTVGAPLQEGRAYSLAVVRDDSLLTLAISIDGELVGSTPITGNFINTMNTFGVGVRGDSAASTQVPGRYDEPLVFDRALTQTQIRALHLLPATGAEANLVYGWHLDDASGGTAAPFAGATSLTLTNTSWVGGRSAAADLARAAYYRAGYVITDLDTDSWRGCLNQCPADCGWFVGAGETALVVTRLILGGLGFVSFKVASVIHIRRFVGVTDVPDVIYSERVDVQSTPIVASQHDPPIWSWQILYNHNNTQLSASSIAGALATSDPDRYQYGQVLDLTATQLDYSIKQLPSGAQGRFPSAVSKVVQTALLNKRDAQDEATRLLALHRDASDTKTVPMWLLAGNGTFMQECAFDISECEMDQSDWIVIGVNIQDEQVTVTIWRPASQTYVVGVRETDDGSERVTDDGGLRIVD